MVIFLNNENHAILIKIHKKDLIQLIMSISPFAELGLLTVVR